MQDRKGISMGLVEKNKVWEEINNLSHIGRSGHDIEQALIAKGYDKALLKEILTNTFMDRLIEKEEMFSRMQQSSANQAAEQAEIDENEAAKQKNQVQWDQQKEWEAELVIQQREIQKADDERKRIDLETQRINVQYGTNVMEQDQARHRAEDEEEDKKRENERRLHLETSI